MPTHQGALPRDELERRLLGLHGLHARALTGNESKQEFERLCESAIVVADKRERCFGDLLRQPSVTLATSL